jgi:sporulation protein YunB
VLAIPLYARLADSVTEMAAATAKNHVAQLINAAVAERMARGGMDYASFISLERDQSGKVSALMTNVSTINMLKTELTESIMQSLERQGSARVNVPVGNLIGSHLTIGRGPQIPVRIVVLGAATVTFTSVFTAAGINQTRHRILLDVSVDVKSLMAGDSATATVVSQIVVAETVLIGSVPDNYTYLESGDSRSLEDNFALAR